jgi:hypothetical protein
MTVTTATVSLFFDDTLIDIDDGEAPRHVLDKYGFAPSYFAVLKKRFGFGYITAGDFLKNARRLVTLCNAIYQGSEFCLVKDGASLDINRLNPFLFQVAFMCASSMMLKIDPKVSRGDLFCSFASILWTAKRPRTIFFYAQDGIYNRDDHRSLKRLLFRKLFYVSSAAPSVKFAVKLGIDAYAKEKG